MDQCMYRNAFLQDSELNSGVPSIRRTDASGKAPRYSVREVGGLLLAKGSSECPKPISHPPQPTPGRHRIGRRCAPVCPAPTAVNTRALPVLLPTCSGVWLPSKSASQVPRLSVPFSSHPCTETLDTVPVPGHPEPGVRESSGCPPSGLRWPLRPLSSLRSTTKGLASGKKGGSFPRPSTSLGMRFRALTLLTKAYV